MERGLLEGNALLNLLQIRISSGSIRGRWLFCGLAAVYFLGTGGPVFAAGPGMRTLRGHVPTAVARFHLQPIGRLPATNRLNLAVALPLRNQAELNALLQELYNPASPNFHKFLTPEQFAQKFGPTENDYQTVTAYLQTNGFTVTGTHSDRMLLDVSAPVTNIERAFHLTMRWYQHPTEKRQFYAPDVNPSIPSNIPILNVSGLNNYTLPQPLLYKEASSNRVSNATPASGSGPGGNYVGNDFRAAYVPGVTLNGAGQSVGLLEFDGYDASDITTYEQDYGLPNVTLKNVLLDNYSGTAGANSAEVSLDIEMAISMAPGLSRVVVYEAGPGGSAYDILDNMATNILVRQISSSWTWGGGPDPSLEDQWFQKFALQGQSYFQASGDSDAYVGSTSSDYPSDDAYMTSVGGTTLTMNGTGASYASETVWNWGYDSAASEYVGSSGGISTSYAIPGWQGGINSFLANGGSTTMRNVPDVALTADNVWVIYGGGKTGEYGGTSCAAPLWAGFMALVNQQLVETTGIATNSVGFINPAIYEIANESIYNSAFNDITTGNNTSSSSPNAFYATSGYDLCTGLGTPAGATLINALVNPDPLIVVSNGGFNAVGTSGGTFNVAAQTFYLTNASASPLTWSLVNTSSWLNASGGGTLAVGPGGTPVTVGLNTAVAANLPPGIYTANLGFSNVTSGVTHYRFFTVTVKDALAILPANNFSFIGPSGGPFAPASQSVILSNAQSGVLNWSLNNPSAWFNVSPSSGSLASGAQTNVTVTPAPAATNLVDGTYSATLQVTNLASQVVQTVALNLYVSESLVQNGGFETGDFTGWTLNANDGGSPYNFVASASSGLDFSPHSGTYFAALGEVGTPLAYLSQTLPTSAGQKYLLSLWLYNPVAGSFRNAPNEFSVSWNGSTLYDKKNIAQTSWLNMQYVVSATGGSTVLQIGGRDDTSYLGLDDVSVTPVFAPMISTQPTNETVLAGSNAAFSVTAGGTPSLVYKWRKNGTNLVNGGNISGATTNVLQFTAATTNNTGNYTVVITNNYGSITSAVATLTVTPTFAPTISTQPTNQTVFAGGNAVFTMTAGGTPPLVYQWRKNGNNLANGGNISGATTNVLQFTAATTSNNGNYTVVITNNYGSITSAVATLTVNLQQPVIALASSENPAGFRDNLNFTASLTPASATGGVQFFTNGVFFDSESLAAGSAASGFTAVLPRGTNLVTAIYSGDANDLPATNSLAQVVTNHPPVATPYFTKRFADLPLDIPVADLSSNWSDVDGDTVSLAAIGVSTNGVTVTNNAGTLVYWNTNNVNDEFTCTITDGMGGTNYQNVYLTVVPLPNNAIPAISSLVVSGGNTISLNLTGASNFAYVLETTTNLNLPDGWLPVATNVVGSNGLWQFSGAIKQSAAILPAPACSVSGPAICVAFDGRRNHRVNCAVISRSPFHFQRRLAALLAGLALFFGAQRPVFAAGPAGIGDNAMREIAAMEQEKATRTPAQRKLDSQFVYQLKFNRHELVPLLQTNLHPRIRFAADGRVAVDIDANVTDGLLEQIRQAGGEIVTSTPRFHSLRALVPLDALESLAASTNVNFIRRAEQPVVWRSVESQGDITHGANLARASFGVNGAGVKVGVLSDGLDYLSNAQATGDLPANVIVLPGQGGSGGDEGTTMLEIVNNLAPGAQLYFATATNGEAQFAQNILNLRSNGCNIIVDDTTYPDESPFQDGIIAQAVNTVTANGALYFSAAGNNGNLDDGTSSVWEGNFLNGGAVTGSGSPITNYDTGSFHNFGTASHQTNYDTAIGIYNPTEMVLFWSDHGTHPPMITDLFVLDPNGKMCFMDRSTRKPALKIHTKLALQMRATEL